MTKLVMRWVERHQKLITVSYSENAVLLNIPFLENIKFVTIIKGKKPFEHFQPLYKDSAMKVCISESTSLAH